MKAITVHQPWAWLIVQGYKRVENRTWNTQHRGPLAIHAGKKRMTEKEFEAIRKIVPEIPDAEKLDYGKIVGQVYLVTSMQKYLVNALLGDTPFVSGPWCWELARAKPLAQPYPFRGQQSFFDVPDEVMKG